MTEQPAFDLTPEPSKPNRLPTIESSDAGPGKQLTSLNNPETRLKLAESEPAGAFWAFCLLVILISVAAAFLSRKPIHLPPSDEIVAALVGWRPGDGVLRSKLQLAVEGAVDWTEAGLVWLHVAVIQPHWGRFTPEEQVPWSYDVFAGGGPLHWGTMVNVSSGQVMYPTCDSTRADSRQSPVAIVDDGGNADGAVQVVDGDAGLIRSCAVTKWTITHWPPPGSQPGFQIRPKEGQATWLLDGVQYKLLQFHYHMPSEHTLNGVRYPLEGHFVYQAQDGSNSLAVFGILYPQWNGTLEDLEGLDGGRGSESAGQQHVHDSECRHVHGHDVGDRSAAAGANSSGAADRPSHEADEAEAAHAVPASHAQRQARQPYPGNPYLAQFWGQIYYEHDLKGSVTVEMGTIDLAEMIEDVAFVPSRRKGGNSSCDDDESILASSSSSAGVASSTDTPPQRRRKTFYRYDGSLTTPPCMEGVKWTVALSQTPISEDQVTTYSYALQRIENTRETMPLNGRVVRRYH